MSNIYRLVSLLSLLATAGVQAADVIESRQHTFTVEVLASGLDHPWGMAFLPRGTVLITERSGSLRWLQNGTLRREPVAGLPQIQEHGQGGLLDIVPHPDFANNKWLYFSYAGAGDGGYGTEVARARWADGHLESTEVLFRAQPKSSGGRHFGSRLLFASDGMLYITLGERGNRRQAQDLGTHPGSIIRLHADGRVPADNPFIDTAGARPEIYTYGNRNAQGIALQPGSGRIWAHEHGPQGGDEVNIIIGGANYGWPVITFGRNYGTGTRIGDTHKQGMAQPRLYWVPSIAPSGMAFYDADAFPAWRGDLFVGSLKFGLLVRLEVKDDEIVEEERMFDGRYGRIRDVRVGPEGYLYVLTDESDGKLLRLMPVKP